VSVATSDGFDLLKDVPGGQGLLDWFGGPPEFGDAEITGLQLSSGADSALVLTVVRGHRTARVTFVLQPWIDVSLRGFNEQNVIGGLTLSRPEERVTEPWERGVGCVPGEIELRLAPCFGAYGAIRATIKQVLLSD
jgi:hypothetical protein